MLYGSVGLLLLSAAAGYWVLERAQAQKKDLKHAGRVIGWAIIIVSFIGVACRVWAITMCQTGACDKSWCPMHPKKAGGLFCPLTSKASSGELPASR